jgi:4-hydroxy-tetrahydrodipicolinate synthase
MQTNRRQFLGAALTAAAAASATATASAEVQPKFSLRGIYPIMQTPFLETLEVDEESLRKETDYLVRCGVHGMVWPAGAGEYASLSHSERERYAEVIVKEARHRAPVFIACQGTSRFEAIEYVRHAERIGADGIHVMGQTDGCTDAAMLTEYFVAVGKATKLPLSIQVNSPAMTSEFMMSLEDKIPNYVISKEENTPMPWSVQKYATRHSRLIVSTGGGAVTLMNEMERGSGGTMAGAGFADIEVSIWNLFHEGKKAEARELFGKFLQMAVLEKDTGYVVQKEILRRRGIFKTVTMRKTRKFTMDAGDLKELDAIMELMKPHFRV